MTDTNMNINEVNQTENTTSNNVTTDVANVSTGYSLQMNDTFKETLLQIPVQLAECDSLLDEYRANADQFFKKHSDEEIENVISKLFKLHGFTRNIESSKKDIKRYLNAQRDAMIAQLDCYLEGADFDKLLRAEADMKSLKNDMSRIRCENRWTELERVFDDAFDTVQGQYALSKLPALNDFSKFRNNHTDLVTGAKTKPVTDAMKKVVRDYVMQLYDAVILLEQNPWKLGDKYIAELINSFLADSDYLTLNARGQRFKSQEEMIRQQEFERKKREEEQKALAEQKRIAEEENMKRIKEMQNGNSSPNAQIPVQNTATKPVEPAKVEAKVSPIANFIPIVMRDKYPMVCEYIEYCGKYNTVHTSQDTKAGLLYDIMLSVTNPSSPFGIEIGNNSVKLLEVVRYIIDM